jgi:hypothetical protein
LHYVYGGDACIENNLDGEANFRIKNSNAASGGAGTIALEFDSNDANNTRILQTNGLTEIGFSDHFQIRKRGAGTPNLYIDNGASSGNVGIGTTSPSEKLDIDGAICIKDGMTAPSTHSGKASIYIDSADGDLKIKFGDGTVKTIVTD